MNCYLHPDREPVGACTSCGRPICRECAVEVQGKLLCRECLGAGKATLPQASAGSRPAKDRSIAIILEILPGLFGFLGFGWIYSGNTSKGVGWLVSVLIWDFLAFFIVALTGGLGCFFTVPVNLVLVAVSASSLNSYVREHPELFGS
jgi:hypothetical protein